MSRSRVRGAVTMLVLGIALTGALGGCGTAAGTPSLDPGTTPASAPSSPVEGIVVKIDTSGLNDFRGFQLRLDSGHVVPFTLGRLENAVDFPPSHLPEHMAASDRLRVTFTGEGAALVVRRIDHASASPPPGG